MKKIILVALLMLASLTTFAQEAPTSGFLLPRITTTQRDAMVNPAKGITIFNTTTNSQETNTGTNAAPVWTSAKQVLTPYTMGVDNGNDGTVDSTLKTQRFAFNGDGTEKALTDNQLLFSDNGGIILGKLASIDGTYYDTRGNDAGYLSPQTLSLAASSRRTDINLTTTSSVDPGNGSLLAGLRSRGTLLAKQGVLAGDKLLMVTGGGFRNDNEWGYQKANIDFFASADFTATAQDARVEISATAGVSTNRILTVTGAGTRIGNEGVFSTYIAPNASALLEVSSTTQGFLPPRMTQTQLAAIVTPAEGLVVYCTNCTPKGLRVYDGTAWTDMNGNQAPANSVAPVVTSAPTTFALGTSVTFSATTGTWSGTPTSYTYQWYYDGAIVAGATAATYTKSAVTAGSYYCAVSAVNGVGVGALTNTNTLAVSSVVPTNSVAPVIAQTAIQFTVTAGTWSDAGSFTYQWKRDGASISGATTQTYDIQVADYNTTITCDVIGVNNIGSATATSNAITHMIGNAAGSAYSLRKVTPTATLAIKVRRSSDNTTQDIGFDGAGNIDNAALTAFIGAGDGFVDTWYDQSSNSRNITQATAANQPQIASAGVIFVRNGKPVVRFNGTSNVLSNTTPWMYNNGAITALAIVIGNTSSNTGLLSETSSTSTNPIYSPIATGASNALTVFARGNSATPLLWSSIQTGVFNNTYKSISIQDSGSTFVATNGTTVSSPFAYSRAANVGVMDPTNRFSIGAWVRTTNGQFWTGDVSEMIIHSVVLPDTLRDGIKVSATTYFGL